VLAGSGHIAGVVNPPAQGKYQYWLNDDPEVKTLEAFIEGATETKGSWWPDWREWLDEHSAKKSVAAKEARVPGEGKLQALEEAPGSYVKTR
jgi:polyhydroxyalkanoate synthase